jgi:hypothetical protein
MKQMRPTVVLPIIQTLLAIGLLLIGSHQEPTVVQDSPPFVPPAVKICEGLNAPASLLAFGVVSLLSKTKLLGFPQRNVWDVAFLVSIALIWFTVGREFETRQDTLVSRRLRLLLDCCGIAAAILLAWFGVEAWHQDELALAIGGGIWFLALTLFYGIRLGRRDRSGDPG